MHEFTGRPFWTESDKVIHTNDSPGMPVPAEGTMLAEASVIPRTIFDLGFRVDVEKRTFFVTALPEFGVEVTLRHLGHIILMQEFALVSLLA